MRRREPTLGVKNGADKFVGPVVFVISPELDTFLSVNTRTQSPSICSPNLLPLPDLAVTLTRSPARMVPLTINYCPHPGR
jgi:hypothetical protein